MLKFYFYEYYNIIFVFIFILLYGANICKAQGNSLYY